jgi:hypothetical protein
MDETYRREMSIPEGLQVLGGLERQWEGVRRMRTLISNVAKLDLTLSRLARQLEAGVKTLRDGGVDTTDVDAALASLRETTDALRKMA